MKYPIKFKADILLRGLERIIPSRLDPSPIFGGKIGADEFSRRISSICLGGVWKTTQSSRHTRSNVLLKNAPALHQSTLKLLDVGVSDGTTCVDLFAEMGHVLGRFYATDLYFNIDVVSAHGRHYIFRHNGPACEMAVSGKLIFYSGTTGGRSFAARWSRRVCSDADSKLPRRPISLVNPRLKELMAAEPRISIREWDMFTPWDGECVDVVRAANILNASYFSPDRLRVAICHMASAIRPEGHFLVVDNRREESASLFVRAKDGFAVVGRFGAGCEIEDLIVRLRF